MPLCEVMFFNGTCLGESEDMAENEGLAENEDEGIIIGPLVCGQMSMQQSDCCGFISVTESAVPARDGMPRSHINTPKLVL